MNRQKILFDTKRFSLTIQRLCLEVLENHRDFDDVCFIGIQDGGAILGQRMIYYLQQFYPGHSWKFGKIDPTFYRDDFRRNNILEPRETHMPFLVENMHVILIDDVLYTGRTVQASLSALMHYGRPKKVELVTLIDRRFNRHLPITSDYMGLKVDALDNTYINVEWTKEGVEKQVLITPQKK